MAVGSAVTTSSAVVTLAEQWNGATWSLESTPDVSGALQTFLTSVACPSTTDCLAVGYSLSTSATVPVAEQWNGTTWTLLSPASPAGSADNELAAVNCPTTSDCIAVGRTYATASSPASTLAEEWNGATWSVMTTPNPSGVLGSFLVSLSCSSGATCEAAGEAYLDNAGDTETLVESLSSGSWSLATTPNEPGVTTSLLSAVACSPSASSCVAVGQYYTPDNDYLLAMVHRAGVWTLTRVPGLKAPAAAYLQGAACSTSGCIAVGYDFPADSFNTDGLVEQRSGTKWTLGKSAEPAGAVVTDLFGASCPSSKVCFAAGDVGIGASGQAGDANTFAEERQGSSWAVMTTPDPTGAEYSRLTAIACTSTSTCVATGYSESTPGSPPSAFAEQLTNTTWSLLAVPEPVGATSYTLAGIACPAPTSCEAVGSFIDASGLSETLDEQWSGTTWTISKTPNVKKTAADELLGVACSAPGVCLAVGVNNLSDGDEATLAEKLSSGSWSIVASPKVAGAFYSVLTGVACSSKSDCSASGYSVGGSGDSTLLEQWNGHQWVFATGGVVPGDYATGLNGVACSSAASCIAVGSGPDGFGQDDALVEQN